MALLRWPTPSRELRDRFQRRDAVVPPWGILSAEGLEPMAEFVSDASDFMSGQIDAEKLARRAVLRHRHQGRDAPR